MPSKSFFTRESLEAQLQKITGVDKYMISPKLIAELNNTISKLVKHHAKKFQTGGRYLLPQEYFGIDSGNYSSKHFEAGTSMLPTSTLIRPPMLAVMQGGGSSKQNTYIASSKLQKYVASVLEKQGVTNPGAVQTLTDKVMRIVNMAFTSAINRKTNIFNVEIFKSIVESSMSKQ